MKALLKILVLTVFVVLSVYLYLEFSAPPSRKIQDQITRHFQSLDQRRYLEDFPYRQGYDDAMHLLKFRLAQAYNDEKRPKLAVEGLRGLIREESDPNVTLTSSELERQAGYYRELGRSYQLIGDPKEAAMALDHVRLLSEKKEILARQELEIEAMRKRHEMK